MKSEEAEQLSRLQKRDNCDENAARSRINAQMPLSEKLRRATHIVDNSGDPERTRTQVNNLIDEFNASRLPFFIRGALLVLLALTILGLTQLIALL
ncbi:unnamed protein product [Toxocara canis]|uniref:Dephospho-CoA kinase n=1 Tax=Toxocara canis TaxID=6265 RepID=A0A183V7W9_TOXCA|nr:unnamed protein product [Toxocara canis]